jgi:two-component system chemotaxis sensor kinase CheA
MDELLTDFLTEASESLTLLDLELVKLEQNPDDKEILGNIFRVVHTVKGTCGFIGLTRLEHVAHAGENILGKIRDGKIPVTPAVISLILEALDCIKVIVEYLSENAVEPEGEDTELITRLNYCADTGQIAGEETSAPAEVTAPAELSEEEKMNLEAGFTPVMAPSSGEEAPKELTDDEKVALEAGFEPVMAAAAEPTEEEKINKEAGFEPVMAKTESAPAAAEHAPVAEAPKAKAEEAHAKPKGEDAAANAANQSIRVNLPVLEKLMQLVSELLLTRNQLLQVSRNSECTDFQMPLQRLSQITTDLQDGVMKTRMQPIGSAWGKFPRLIRDLSLELGKKIDLQMTGEETEIDRQMLEMVKDPLTHMVRNSADHGLETIEERKTVGKPETGIIHLSAYHEGGNVIIKISDDGRGVNIERVKQKAIENGLATEAEVSAMNDQQICQFIFKPGFSTAEKITSVSGRGVGMDVVQTNIEKIGGTIELTSQKGKGSVFLIKIPLTLAIMSVLLVECEKQKYAIPQVRVVEIVQATEHAAGDSDTEYKIELLNEIPVLRLRGKLLPIISLNQVLKVGKYEPHTKKNLFVVVCNVGSSNFGLIVDKVLDTEEIVVKPVSSSLRSIIEYSGTTILGDGSVIMILDPTGIIKNQPGSGLGDTIEVEHEAVKLKQNVEFLLFSAGGKSPKAVPLELVSRLEEIDFATLEWSGETRVVQYNDDLMRITSLSPDVEIPDEGIHQLVVFSDEDKIMGLMVDNIIDIVEHEMDIKSMTGKNGVLGSLVINHVTTDLIDISHFFSKTFSEWPVDPSKENKHHNQDGKHILLVDDSAFFRKYMTPVLTVADYKVTTVDSAVKALQMLEDGLHCDLIVSDIAMPEMTGIEFVKICRGKEKLKHMPIIALTAYNNDEMINEINGAGFDSFVSKSDRNKLVSIISGLMSKMEVA